LHALGPHAYAPHATDLPLHAPAPLHVSACVSMPEAQALLPQGVVFVG
jgi:hypothetical protein